MVALNWACWVIKWPLNGSLNFGMKCPDLGRNTSSEWQPELGHDTTYLGYDTASQWQPQLGLDSPTWS